MNDKILYLECYSGISGDMTVAALLDLGADQKVLMDGLNSLKVEGYTVKIDRTAKSTIDACDFNVIIPDIHTHDHLHAQDDLQEHNHPKEHDQDNEYVLNHMQLGRHEHRNLLQINEILDQSSITDHAKAIAKKIFRIIAVAEAKVHAKPLEEVHFHEVGAVDSIVDIVASAICLDNLSIQNVIVSELYEGTGQIMCQHGLLPVPVPAVVNIASEYQLPLHITDVKGELVTPTGAAIVAAIKTGNTLPAQIKVLRVGLGAGKRSYSGASGILRAMIVEDISPLS